MSLNNLLKEVHLVWQARLAVSWILLFLSSLDSWFPASLAARGSHVTQFWPMSCMGSVLGICDWLWPRSLSLFFSWSQKCRCESGGGDTILGPWEDNKYGDESHRGGKKRGGGKYWHHRSVAFPLTCLSLAYYMKKMKHIFVIYCFFI